MLLGALMANWWLSCGCSLYEDWCMFYYLSNIMSKTHELTLFADWHLDLWHVTCLWLAMVKQIIMTIMIKGSMKILIIFRNNECKKSQNNVFFKTQKINFHATENKYIFNWVLHIKHIIGQHCSIIITSSISLCIHIIS